MNNQLISEEEIKKNPNAIIYDPYNDSNDINLPNVSEIMDSVIEILEYMSNDNIKQLKQNNINEYNDHMETKFEKFAERYYSLFMKVISGEDITPLFNMLHTIEKIKSGELTMDKAEETLGNELAEKYVYPKLSTSQREDIKKSVKKHRKNKK
jgi:hypothetical protein